MTTDSVGACGIVAEGASREAVNERDRSVPDEDKASWSPAGNCRLALMPVLENPGLVSKGIVSEGAVSDGVFSILVPGRTSRRVVEDDAERVTRAGAHAAHPVTHHGAEVAARAARGSVARREDDDLALLGRHGFAARLGARPLLDQQELAAGVVDARAGEEAGELQGEDDVAVEVLVEAVVAPRLVVEQERGRLGLAPAAAAGQGGGGVWAEPHTQSDSSIARQSSAVSLALMSVATLMG